MECDTTARPAAAVTSDGTTSDGVSDSANRYHSLLHFKPDLRTCDMRIVIAQYGGPDRFTILPTEVLMLICDADSKGYISNVLRCVSKHLIVLPFKSWFLKDDRWASDRLANVNNRLNLGTFVTEDVEVKGLCTMDIYGKRFVGFLWRCSDNHDSKVTAAVRERCSLLRIPVPGQFRRIHADVLRLNHRGRPLLYSASPRKSSGGLRQLLLAGNPKGWKASRKKTWKYDAKSYGRK